VLLRDGFDSRLRERRKVCRLDCPHALSDFGMVRLQVSDQEFDRTAFGGPVSDQHDLVGRDQLLGDLLIK
jgi:hypothetical protein